MTELLLEALPVALAHPPCPTAVLFRGLDAAAALRVLVPALATALSVVLQVAWQQQQPSRWCWVLGPLIVGGVEWVFRWG